MPKKKQSKEAKKTDTTPHPQIMQSEIAIMQSIAKKKSGVEQKMQRFVAMTAMLLLIFTNILGAILLIPFLLFFEGLAQYAIIAMFAIGFGLIFNFMIHSIEHLGDKHHLIAGIVVPTFALFDLVVLFTLLERIKEVLKVQTEYNYTLIIVLFVAAFLIPYIIDIIRGKHIFQ